ncbi:nitrilase family protein [Tenacibaculum finnmarkense]|uniref:nitrilase family protein n=1 Tax=Tenacibaculum finnmarkense TaxID=2781243 RepID=UPI001E5AC7E3|nr:nitrilase family protein [Tenacibaculum finnmarkense]MCD8412584.1 nitrilase family protein [Tenacibaculum finnmarkense genomovar ulcerans]MCG8206363.1 nitrilase family protein [Tenacibaculum finnmarkense genomovar finnmarkense]MCG8722407.1 nitrilase family protein [Tenacibaculum finnmarkense]MCG8740680.1 nitrilase family protein [Tenacibaculum finnmarkense]MCG8764076.1 nitrilase family protein [Tenacibaculum finnmarkense]
MNTYNKLKTALVQSDIVWENPTENRKLFEEKINKLSSDVDLIILPEMFTTGFNMKAHLLAETMNGDTVNWMKRLSKEKNCAITGSIIIKEKAFNSEEKERYFNRLLFVHPSGKIDFYDKKHLFTLAGEQKIFTAGSKKSIVNYKDWKICLLICYDLRFPAWARNTKNYDVLLYVANWPSSRIDAWDTLLKARAIENMSYTIGVNRVGTDANGHQYNGNSVSYDTLGNCIDKNNNGEEVSLLITLDKEKQAEIRSKFGFLNDKDAFVFN